MKKFIVLSMVLMLGGCASNMVIPSTEVIDSTGKIVTKTSDTIGDTSAYRTHEKYEAYRVGYTEYVKAFSKSGFKMDYKEITLSDGSKTFLPIVSYNTPPVFVAPADLKDHPVWGTINNTINKVTPWAFGSWAATSIFGSFADVAQQPTYQYQGDVMMQGSMNSSNKQSIDASQYTPAEPVE